MKKIMKCLNVAAFTVLLIGGLNYLFAGLFGLDVFVSLFGTSISVAGRIVYSIIGIAATLLLLTVIARAVMNDRKTQEVRTR